MKKQKKKIYYGPDKNPMSHYWTVSVSNAKKNVIVNGNVLHALQASAGVTIGCGLSNVASDKTNADAFPHPVHLASFTKTTAVIIDKLNKDGSPKHGVVYEHSYGHITEKNDNRTLKKLVKEDPSIIERSLTLRVPRVQKYIPGAASGKSNAESLRGKSIVPKGALARAVEAGHVGRSVAQQMANLAA